MKSFHNFFFSTRIFALPTFINGIFICTFHERITENVETLLQYRENLWKSMNKYLKGKVLAEIETNEILKAPLKINTKSKKNEKV